ncbi:MAG: hypothetical protein RL033_4843 [Pseudomonadota bacterium]|jgi:UPF0716 family protein affecting phage T7 exclusion
MKASWRLSTAIRMGLTWAAVWFGAGILLARVPGFFSDLPFALLLAPPGFVTGIIFSAIVVGVERRRGAEPLSPLRLTAWGAASGLLLSGAFAISAALRGEAVWGELLVFGPLLTVASAVSAVASLAVAKRAERRPGSVG